MSTDVGVSDLAREIGLAMVEPVASIAAKLQEKIRAEEQEKARAMVSEEVDKALAMYAPEIRAGGNSPEGVVSFGAGGHEAILAKFAHLTMADNKWYPLVMKADAGGKLSESEVKIAVSEFLAGGPVNPMSIGSDTEIGVLLSIMEACGQKAVIDPHAVAAVRGLRNYTCGSGVHVNCAVEDVDDTIDEFMRRNSFQRRLKSAVAGRYIYGEHYFFYYVDPASGDVTIRDRCKPYEIIAIQTHPDDCETRLAYGRTPSELFDAATGKYVWFPDINYWEQRKSPVGAIAKDTGRMSKYRLVQMVKDGSPGAVRGIPRMYPVLRFHRYYDDFIVDRVILNHERTKVVWIRKITGNQPMQGGRAQYAPAGGQILTETAQIAWRAESPKIDGADSQPDARMLRLAIAAGWGIPEHILFQDASEQVYASIRSQDTPFSNDIRSQQADWAEDVQVMFRTVIREKVAAGKLKDTMEVEVFTTESINRLESEVKPMLAQGATRSEILEVVEALAEDSPTKTVKIPTVDTRVDVQFPEVVRQDPLQMAQETEVLDRVGVFSKSELAARHGGNYRRSAKLMMIEKDWVPQPEPPVPGQAAGPGAAVDPKQKAKGDQKRNAGRSTFGKPNPPSKNDPKTGSK